MRRRLFLTGAAIAAFAPRRSVMTTANEDYARQRWIAVLQPLVPWIRIPTFRQQSTSGWDSATYDWTTGEHVVWVTAGPPPEDRVLAHEAGHVVANWIYNARNGLQWPDLYTEWLAFMGADPTLRSHPQVNEMFADHWMRGVYPSEPGLYVNLRGLVPFDQAKERSFVDLSAIEEDGMKWISGDLLIHTDAGGNANVAINPTGLRPGVPVLGVVNRIGVAGSEQSLPDATYEVRWTGQVAFGTLTIRGDSVRGGDTYWRVGAFQ